MLGLCNRLSVRIFSSFFILLLVVQGVTFWLTFRANEQLSTQQLENKLTEVEWAFRSEYANRQTYLGAFAETVAKDFALKEFFIDADKRSFLVALNNHRKRIDASIAMTVDINGDVIAQLVQDTESGRIKKGPDSDKPFPYLDAIKDREMLYPIENRIYQLRFASISNGGSSVIGWVGFGYPIDEALAQDLNRLTGLKVGFLTRDTAGQLTFLSSSESSISKEDQQALSLHLKGQQRNEHYFIWSEPIGALGESTLLVYMYQSNSDLLGALKKQWLQQLWLLLLLLPLTMIVALLITRSVSHPINRLIEQAKFIAQGNYDFTVSVGNNVEMKALAREFSSMQQAVLTRENQIRHQANHDPLTNLPNRNYLSEVVGGWLAEGHPVAVCVIKIRGMSEVNQTLGYQTGDQVISVASQRLNKLEGPDLGCHLTSDEFVLVFKRYTREELIYWIPSLIQTMDIPFDCQGITMHLRLTCGISFWSSGQNLVSMLRQADNAMRKAKNDGEVYRIYDPQDDKHTVERLQLIHQLKSAIESGHLVLWYQPKLSLQTGKVSHVEALVRWQHPVKGIIPPDTFIPIAEKTGQMKALTFWVLREAISQYQRWKTHGREIHIAINISAENLKDKSFAQKVTEVTRQSGVPLNAITLEITEDAVVADPECAIEQLKSLQEQGFKLSIDDYGTGYSSLAQLKQLPVDELKIDRSFVQHLMQDAVDQTIVSSTISMAHSLGLSVVAEGIEDAGSLDWLRSQGCEKGQGYYLSRPLDAKALEVWINQQEGSG
ncbi:EAL domain-containing protein [Parasalinivibrio latis]|uniref:EAL domain-containing protein n=1 Tax=Parasalinivibrio latis TaxID=2952610 RepID=UPI0030E265B9